MSRAEEIAQLIAYAVSKTSEDFQVEIHFTGGNCLQLKIPKTNGFFSTTEKLLYCGPDLDNLPEDTFQKHLQEIKTTIDLALDETAARLKRIQREKEEKERKEYERLKAKFGGSNA